MKLLRPRIGHDPWVGVNESWADDITFDDGGFQYPGHDRTRVHWADVIRVARGYEISSFPIGIADWDFWAFQTTDTTTTFWVWDGKHQGFTDFVVARFQVGHIPPMKDWLDQNFCKRAYVVWPEKDIGEPMYHVVKRHWWSWQGRLVHAHPCP